MYMVTGDNIWTYKHYMDTFVLYETFGTFINIVMTSNHHD